MTELSSAEFLWMLEKRIEEPVTGMIYWIDTSVILAGQSYELERALKNGQELPPATIPSHKRLARAIQRYRRIRTSPAIAEEIADGERFLRKLSRIHPKEKQTLEQLATIHKEMGETLKLRESYIPEASTDMIELTNRITGKIKHKFTRDYPSRADRELVSYAAHNALTEQNIALVTADKAQAEVYKQVILALGEPAYIIEAKFKPIAGQITKYFLKKVEGNCSAKIDLKLVEQVKQKSQQ
jgi:hypothetical protein